MVPTTQLVQRQLIWAILGSVVAATLDVLWSPPRAWTLSSIQSNPTIAALHDASNGYAHVIISMHL